VRRGVVGSGGVCRWGGVARLYSELEDEVVVRGCRCRGDAGRFAVRVLIPGRRVRRGRRGKRCDVWRDGVELGIVERRGVGRRMHSEDYS